MSARIAAARWNTALSISSKGEAPSCVLVVKAVRRVGGARLCGQLMGGDPGVLPRAASGSAVGAVSRWGGKRKNRTDGTYGTDGTDGTDGRRVRGVLVCDCRLPSCCGAARWAHCGAVVDGGGFLT